MVFNQNSGENSSEKRKINKKIYTCQEIEDRELNRKSRRGSFQNLKHVDTAVLFSSSTDMTRYDKADLLSLKDGRLSQQPPRCYYEPNVMRLNILKYRKNNTEEIEAQMKVFREKLQNLTFSSWDPNLLHLLRSYHNALLNPFNNCYPNNNYGNQQQQMFNSANVNMQQQQYASPRRVSFMDKQQAAVLDKIPSYDRNLNFFDNITTTATMRPPRMGVNAYNNNNNKRPNHNNNNNINNSYTNTNNYVRKPNSCASDHASSYSSSHGYYSGNDTKSSCEESISDKHSVDYSQFVYRGPCEKMHPKTFFKNNSPMGHVNSGSGTNISNIKSQNAKETEKDEEEKEPEWFSVPATLEDFIDLHGFEDEADESSDKKEVKQTTVTDVPKSQGGQERRSSNISFNNSYNRNNFGGYNNNNSSNNRNMNFNKHQHYNYNNVNNQRFRNPLHFNKPYAPRQSVPTIINPFFDAWRNGKFLNQQNVSFTELMQQQNNNNFPKNLPSSAVHISEIENRMKQHQSLNGIAPQPIQPAAVPQFFDNLANNWGVRLNQMPSTAYQQYPKPNGMPTREQMEHITSEIMRNAIIRKNQQYHDENNNYQK